MSKKKINLERKWMKKAEAWKDYAETLEGEKAELLRELTEIAVGFVLTSQPSQWSTEIKLQDRAAKKVRYFATKEHPKKPKGYFYE